MKTSKIEFLAVTRTSDSYAHFAYGNPRPIKIFYFDYKSTTGKIVSSYIECDVKSSSVIRITAWINYGRSLFAIETEFVRKGDQWALGHKYDCTNQKTGIMLVSDYGYESDRDFAIWSNILVLINQLMPECIDRLSSELAAKRLDRNRTRLESVESDIQELQNRIANLKDERNRLISDIAYDDPQNLSPDNRVIYAQKTSDPILFETVESLAVLPDNAIVECAHTRNRVNRDPNGELALQCLDCGSFADHDSVLSEDHKALLALSPSIVYPSAVAAIKITESTLVRYAVIKANGIMHGSPVLVPLSKIIKDIDIARNDRGFIVTLEYGRDPREKIHGRVLTNIFMLRIHDTDMYLPDPLDLK